MAAVSNGHRDPLEALLNEEVLVSTRDGKSFHGVLFMLTYHYVTIRHPLIVFSREEIARIECLNDGK